MRYIGETKEHQRWKKKKKKNIKDEQKTLKMTRGKRKTKLPLSLSRKKRNKERWRLGRIFIPNSQVLDYGIVSPKDSEENNCQPAVLCAK